MSRRVGSYSSTRARQNVALPSRRGHLEAVELTDHRREAFQPRGPMLGIHPLPGQQEPDEIRRAHRLDLRAEAVQRVAMDARQQPPLAPLELGRRVTVAWGEAAAEHHSLRLQRDERRFDLDVRDAQCRGEGSRSGRTDDAESSTDQLADGGLSRRRIVEQFHFRAALGRDPDGRSAVDGLESRCTPGLDQLAHVLRPIGGLRFGQEAGGEQCVVQLVRVLDLGPDLLPHPLDGGGIERAEVGGGGGLERTAGVHRLRAALLQRCVVEELVGPRVEDLVRQRRRLGKIARDQPDLARVDPAEHGDQPVDVHHLVEAIVERLPHQRVIGDLTIARDVLQAGGGVREGGGEQILRLHPLDLGRHLASATTPRQGQGDRGVPSPVGPEHRGVEQRLDQDVAHGVGMEVAEHGLQGERVLRTQ